MDKIVSQQVHFGTIVTIEEDNPENKNCTEGRQEEIRLILKNLEVVLSPYDNASLISKINESAGIKDCPITGPVRDLLREAKNYSRLTNGAFDITIGPLMQLWGFGYKKNTVPSNAEIKKVLPLINYESLEINQEGTRAILLREGQSIHPGAIAKGFACDLLKQKFNKSSLLINMGGNVQLINLEKIVGIQDPFNKPGLVAGFMKVYNQSVVTSGINERYFWKFFKLYHHLLDPSTGRQPEHDLASVTVINPSSTEADALATAFFILGMEKSKKIIKERNLDVAFINKRREIFCNEGIFHKLSVKKNFTKLPLI
jgi:thiamine biosynthesis lipoprotein